MTEYTRKLATTTALLSCTCLGAQPLVAQSLGAGGFSISVGEDVIAGAPPPYRAAPQVDRQLQAADINVQFDTLARSRLLNVLTADQREAYQAGEQVEFRASMNYPAFVDRAEIRIYDRSRPGRRLIASLPVAPNGTTAWRMPGDGEGDFAYALRVYDAAGRYDETVPAILTRVLEPPEPLEVNAPFAAPGEAEDRTGRRNIPVHGGAVIVSGSGTPGSRIEVMGDAVPVDAEGRFAVSRILPTGDNIITIEAGGQRYLRDVYVPESDWFSTGIIDITAGITEGGQADESDTYIDGRAAFYLNGFTAGGWRITASADTQEGPLEDIFSRLDDTDPLRVLDRLREDGTDLYPTYGDDSTWFDDTPTSGNVFVRAQSDNIELLWGDFVTGIEGPGLLRHNRDLYGLSLSYNSSSFTEEGAPRLSANVFVARPDTAPQRDVLRGTGGSVYFLSRREIVGGSTSVSVQEVDADTGFVVDTRVLIEGRDFRVDHFQGVLILSEPLFSGTSDGTLISGPANERELSLVVQYEFVPTGAENIDGSFGGRVEGWVSENLRFGATLFSEDGIGGRHRMGGVDLRYEMGEASYIELELAQTDGPGFGRATSTDGGLTISNSGTGTANNATAFEGRLALDFGDLGLDLDGRLEAYGQTREEGFETLTESTPADQYVFGLSLDVALNDRVELGFDSEVLDEEGGRERSDSEIRLAYQINETWSVTGALAYLDEETPGNLDRTGTRTDGAVRLTYRQSEDLEIYGFAQGTLERSGGLDRNDRAGIGFDAELGDRLSASAEISGGSGGAGGEARISWRPTDDNELYFGYTLDPTRSPDGSDLSDRGRIVAGANYRYSESVMTFAETVYDRPGDRQSLTQAYGVTYTPSRTWAYSIGVELAEINDLDDGDFDRAGISAGVAWTPDDDRSARVRLEFRDEDGDTTARDRQTWAITAGYRTQVAEDWRLLADLDAIFSESATSSLEDGEYLRASLGYAYRPIDNERLNLLFRFTYLRDLPSADQRGVDGTTDGPEQRSTILSLAANYDLSERWTMSGRLGYRLGEVADRGTDDFTDNTATLAALRFDWHALHAWDFVGEGRVLYTEESETTELGALFAVYRHLNDTVSLGLGYEWGSVSDDLANVDYDGQGLFLNLVGRF
ncbi:MAG: hypothetical protein AAGF68_00320 [Pseudomonadota bacterium]